MSGVWRLVARSSTTIVSLAEAKRQTNTEDFTDDDALLTSLCDLATHHLDIGGNITRRPLLTQTWEYLAPAPICSADLLEARLRKLPLSAGFRLDRAPLQAVTKVEAMQSGAYVEIPREQFVTRSLSDAATWLRLSADLSWPDADVDEEAWRITVRLGYGDSASDVEPALRHAALLLIGHLYQHREAVSGFGSDLTATPLGFDALIAPHRFHDI
ncbi:MULTISPECIES: head-tail connector protein [Methylosinus]|uniref:Phage gp6-like head-tail connector protein n=1 Tax=Methylosinus trichosporium (strain ATCC 35070 / NCIMB 11131 / UNIQEM 75 / OB3b) TaxID=595536 RepID=A0A2D2CYC8_METT3|nr:MULTISPECIES: head-tail connector protein [Methylosinus]ATQ67740.1 hypothetical protein CQW49_07420 [Methylosinus trichosporium OB3b]OBS51152.1 hypothetical protein A8B73_17690 [Methylosinus sp. 3S-1]